MELFKKTEKRLFANIVLGGGSMFKIKCNNGNGHLK